MAGAVVGVAVVVSGGRGRMQRSMSPQSQGVAPARRAMCSRLVDFGRKKTTLGAMFSE
jgi:hypothetical protein